MLGIKTYCHIKGNKVFQDGNLIFEGDASLSLKDFLKALYKNLNLRYNKFYKMDEISKLGFLASEIVVGSVEKTKYSVEDVGIVFANSQSTLVTDANHQESINDHSNYYPSPSVFVYTLPNIMMGEISIRHILRGENAFFIFEHFNTEFVSDYINQLAEAHKIQACLGGWIDQSENEHEAFIYWAEKVEESGKFTEHTGEQVKRLYEKIEI